MWCRVTMKDRQTDNWTRRDGDIRIPVRKIEI